MQDANAKCKCSVEMMPSVAQRVVLVSRKGAKAQRKARFFAPLRLCVSLPSDDFYRAKCEMQNAKCRMQDAEPEMQNSKSRIQNSKLPISFLPATYHLPSPRRAC
jgi:hypothetical protein